nr:IS630 family transposase [Oceanisphaera profunda]
MSDSIKNTDFVALAKAETNARKRMRLLALAHFQEGHSRTDIARFLKVNRNSVNRWVANFLLHGLAGLDSVRPSGRPTHLTTEQLSQLSDYIDQQSRDTSGGRLQGLDIQAYIEKEFGVSYQIANIYRLVHQLGFSWITSRSRHPKRDELAQDLFKKFKLETILSIPGHVALSKVDVWFQDEARFGQQNTTTRLWAKRGSRPRAVQQQQFEYAYLFGAVCPATGATEALLSPVVNREMMKVHLALISARTEPGRHAVVIMDGAGWHTAECANAFSNLTMIKLPPYSPELNPIEQVWSWLRQHTLANRCFNDYNDIIDACTSAWQHFITDVDRVKSLCHRSWINLT